VPASTQFQQGLLYEQARQFAAALEAAQATAQMDMLAAWTDSYWAIRQEMDQFLAKVEAAKIAGTPPSPAWAYQQQRLKNLLDETKVQIARYAEAASEVAEKAQKAAIAAALKHAEKLAKTAVAQSLPGFAADFARVNPAVLEAAAGFLSDGSVLRNHLALTLPGEAAERVQSALIRGLALGKGQDWMTREATKALGLPHSRAVTIMRTESLRAYRHASRATYLANQDVIGTWVWNAHLDARTCVACAIMDGTEHPLDATLDGHPRCRCAMVPRTKSWEDLGLDGVADTRPPIRSGKAWLESQPPHIQRAMMGPAKFNAWVDGQISLDDMVARTFSPQWGTMRTERSLVAILEDRHPNYWDAPSVPPNAGPKPPPQPEAKYAQHLADRHTMEYLEEWLATPGNSPQALANIQAAITLKHLRNAPRQGPSLPRPDMTKVKAALEKLRSAVLTKGYPSKGYSQTQAIYKAQANGTVGTKVGVVKSLTWEQKITAQRILSEHNAELPDLARQWEKKKAIADAHDQALAIHAQKAADDAVEALKKDLAHIDGTAGGNNAWDVAVALKMLDLEDALKAAGDDLVKAAKAQAQITHLKAYRQGYWDAQDTIGINQWKGTTWIPDPPNGSTLVIEDDGWGHLTNTQVSLDLHLPPHLTVKFIDGTSGGTSTWTQVLTPDPTEVAAWKALWTDQDGLVNPAIYDKSKEHLDQGKLTPQQAADLQEALDQDWAAGKWKPEATYVTKIKGFLDDGTVTPQSLRATVLDDPDAKPLSKANAAQALKEWQAEQIAKASIPVPKPAIQVDKIKWEKVSDAQVAKLVAKVQAGDQSVEDLYALFQKAKNAGPKANYAKAILTLEGKADSIPGNLVDQAMFKTWSDDLASGTITPEELEDLITWQGSTAADKATAKAVLAAHKAPTPKPPTPPPAAGPAMPTKPPWRPEDLKDTGTVLGTHGARVYTAPDGTRWLFKPPKDPKDGFLTTLDEATARFQAAAGLKAPDTFVVTLGGRRGSIQRMFPAKDGFPGGFKPTALSEADLGAVQREHALDWLLANHDGHRDQFLRLEDGSMVGIDKGQAFRWMGQDRLDWEFHPNQAYGAPEPVYNALWRAFARGEDVDLDPPGSGPLWDQIKVLQGIPDDVLRDAFREYAEQAAARGLLAKRQNFPGLKAHTIPENDVEAFLDALVARKNRLDQDFRDLYERAAKERAKALPGWKPKAPKVSGTKAKWVGKDKPKPPVAPTEPKAQVAQMFTSWVDEAKARYSAFSGGKNLEDSNNWARFKRVMEDLDESAVDELLARNYLDDATAAEARTLIAAARARKATLEADYKKAQADHKKAVQAYRKDLKDWKEANGVQDLLAGMDDDVLRHKTDAAGLKWAEGKWDGSKYKGTQRQWLRDYTGSLYDALNNALRVAKGKIPDAYKDATKAIDNAMAHISIPEDVILHRGVGAARPGQAQFVLDGVDFTEKDDLTKIIGSVQVDHGFISTSVGNSAAFSGHPIQLKIRAPEGTPASLVTSFSNYGTAERELILGRGQRMFVHNAYKTNGKWFLEVEIVPEDFDPTTATALPSATPWDH
jgi:hypothetical protein